MARAHASEIRAAILDREAVRRRVSELAAETGRPASDVRSELDGYLREMVATHGGPIGDVFVHFARVFDRAAYRDRIRYEGAQLADIRALAARYPVAMLPSHRSYLDPIVLAAVLRREGIAPTFKLGGINVAFWPMGPLGRRAGLIFIRRSFRDNPVYKLALREYVGWLAEHRCHLEWYLEGGRSRTGKLREPRLGVLAYLVDAVHDGRSDDFFLLPISIVYDELLDVEEHVRYAAGAAKRPESLGRLLDYARAQRTRYAHGDVHVSFGEPLSVREYLERDGAPANDDDDTPDAPLQKLAFEVAGRINRVTPITPPALTTMALLWADRAITVDQLLTVIEPHAGDVERRGFPVTARPIASRETVLGGLASLERHGVVTRFDRGREPVYLIQPEQRVAASYYRNAIIHFFVVPAIVDLALAAANDADPATRTDTVRNAALQLRDLLKFEFFFPEREEFLTEVDAEVALSDRPITAPLLRPFLEAYWVTAEALADRGGEAVTDRDGLATEAGALAEQYLLQRRISCADAASNMYAEGAIRLADHRGLLTGDPGRTPEDGDLSGRRAAFAEELHSVVRRVRTTQTWADRRFLDLMRNQVSPLRPTRGSV